MNPPTAAEVAQTLSQADVLLFVRGHISSRRAYQQYFSWDAIAAQYAEALRSVD